MKKNIFIISFLLIANYSHAGSCPMLWNKIDAKFENISEDNLKTKVKELRDAGKEAHSDGDHSKSEKLLNEALELLNS